MATKEGKQLRQLWFRENSCAHQSCIKTNEYLVHRPYIDNSKRKWKCWHMSTVNPWVMNEEHTLPEKHNAFLPFTWPNLVLFQKDFKVHVLHEKRNKQIFETYNHIFLKIVYILEYFMKLSHVSQAPCKTFHMFMHVSKAFCHIQ